LGDLAAATEATAALLSVLHAPQMHPRTLPPSPADCARLRQRTGAATVAVLCGAHGARGARARALRRRIGGVRTCERGADAAE
jgi:hypothetical protein